MIANLVVCMVVMIVVLLLIRRVTAWASVRRCRWLIPNTCVGWWLWLGCTRSVVVGRLRWVN